MAGSLVNPQLLKETRPDCRLYNSAKMTLEEVLEVIEQAHREQACIVRLHTGDPCLYGRHPRADGSAGCAEHPV